MGNTLIQDSATGNIMGLSPGFIPTGIKEHGGIIYITSVNKEGKGEIGTIPSPIIRDLYNEKIYYPVDKELPIDSKNTPIKISHKVYPSDKFIMQLDLSVFDETSNTYVNAFEQTYTRTVFQFKDDTQINYTIESPLITKNNALFEESNNIITTPLGLVSINLYSVNQNGYIKANEKLHQPQEILGNTSDYWYLESPYDFPSDLLKLTLNGDLKQIPSDSKPGYLAVSAESESIDDFGIIPRETEPYNVPFTYKQYNQDNSVKYYSYVPGFYYKTRSGIYVNKLNISFKDIQTGDLLTCYQAGNSKDLQIAEIKTSSEITDNTQDNKFDSGMFNVASGIPHILSDNTLDTFILGCSKNIVEFDNSEYRSFESTTKTNKDKQHGLVCVDLENRPNRWIEMSVAYFNQFDEKIDNLTTRFNPYLNDMFGTNLHINSIKLDKWYPMSWRGDNKNYSSYLVPSKTIQKKFLDKPVVFSYSFTFPDLEGAYGKGPTATTFPGCTFTKLGLVTDVESYNNLAMLSTNKAVLNKPQLKIEEDLGVKNLAYLNVIPKIPFTQTDNLILTPKDNRVILTSQSGSTDKDFSLIKHYQFHQGIRLESSNAKHLLTDYGAFYSKDFKISLNTQPLITSEKIMWSALPPKDEESNIPAFRPYFIQASFNDVKLSKVESQAVLKTKTLHNLINIPKNLEINFSGLHAVDENKNTYDYWTIGYDINTSDQKFESSGANLQTKFEIQYETEIVTQDTELETNNNTLLTQFTITGQDENKSGIPINKIDFSEISPWYKSNLEINNMGIPKNYINSNLFLQNQYSVKILGKLIDSSVCQNNITIQPGQVLPLQFLSAGIYVFNCNLIESQIPNLIQFQFNDTRFGQTTEIPFGDKSKIDFIPYVIIVPESGTCNLSYLGSESLTCTSIGLYRVDSSEQIPEGLDSKQVYTLKEYFTVITNKSEEFVGSVEKYNYIQKYGVFMHLTFTYLEQYVNNNSFSFPKFMDYSYKGVWLRPDEAYQLNVIYTQVEDDWKYIPCYYSFTSESSNSIYFGSDNQELINLISTQIKTKSDICQSNNKSAKNTNHTYQIQESVDLVPVNIPITVK